MDLRTRIISALAAGIASGCAVSWTPLEKKLLDAVCGALGSSPGLIRVCESFPWIVPAGAGILVAVLVFAVFSLFTTSYRAEPISRLSDEEEGSDDTLYHSLSTLVREFLNAVDSRESTKDFTALLQGGAIPQEYFDQMYEWRNENCIFLTSLVNLLSKEPTSHSKEYMSDTHPELIVEEVRSLLQKTLYGDYAFYIDTVQKPADALDAEHIEWKEFRDIITGIRKHSSSLKECLEFYLDMARHEKNKFNKFRDYGVLPLDVGMPDDADLYLLADQKKLGDDFDYGLLLNFKENAGEINIRFNPSIPEVFDFFDTYAVKIAGHMNTLLFLGRPFFKIYQIAFLSDAYRRIKWVYSNINTIETESISYYLETLRSSRIELRRYMKKLNIATLPKPLLQWEDMQKMHEFLDEKLKSSSGSQVIYKTESGRLRQTGDKEQDGESGSDG